MGPFMKNKSLTFSELNELVIAHTNKRDIVSNFFNKDRLGFFVKNLTKSSLPFKMLGQYGQALSAKTSSDASITYASFIRFVNETQPQNMKEIIAMEKEFKKTASKAHANAKPSFAEPHFYDDEHIFWQWFETERLHQDFLDRRQSEIQSQDRGDAKIQKMRAARNSMFTTAKSAIDLSRVWPVIIDAPELPTRPSTPLI